MWNILCFLGEHNIALESPVACGRGVVGVIINLREDLSFFLFFSISFCMIIRMQGCTKIA